MFPRSRLAALLLATCALPALASPSRAAPTEPTAPSVCGTPEDAHWREHAVLYGVAPTLFGNPPLASVTRHLDALKNLGVNALWISPLFRTDDQSAISYSVTDYFSIRSDYGTPEDLHALVRAAHARGIKVLLDIVPNHTSDRHPWYLDAEKNGTRSRYFHFYDRDPSGRATHYFDWKNLENLDYGNPEVRRAITDAFLHWVRDFDVDGFRVDAAWGVRDRAPDFWPQLRRALDEVKPGVFLLAEASAKDGYYVRHGFDAAYDWTKELGHGAWETVFDAPDRIGPALNQALVSPATDMHRVARFLDNNDTGTRFVTRHGVATTRVAAVLLGTLPGIPTLFTGDEVGAEYEPYDDPKPIAWADSHHLTPWYRRVLALREAHPALRCGSFVHVPLPHVPGAYAYVRSDGAGDTALVVLNFGEVATLKVPLPAPLRDVPLQDALTGQPVRGQVSAGGALTLAAPASHAWILVAAPRSR